MIKPTKYGIIGSDVYHICPFLIFAVKYMISHKYGILTTDSLWPEIRQAINTGYTLKEICHEINRNEFSIGYSLLLSLVTRFRNI